MGAGDLTGYGWECDKQQRGIVLGELAYVVAGWEEAGVFVGFARKRTGHWQSSQQDELFVWTLADNGVKQLTHVTGNIDFASVVADGKAIAFLFVENATWTAGALAAMKPWSGVVGEDGVEVQRGGRGNGRRCGDQAGFHLPTGTFMSLRGHPTRRRSHTSRRRTSGREQLVGCGALDAGPDANRGDPWHVSEDATHDPLSFCCERSPTWNANCRASLLSGWQADRLYRRIDERPRLDR